MAYPPATSILAEPIYTDVRYYVGDEVVPHDVKLLRRSTHEAMQRVGTPVILKRMYTIADTEGDNPPAKRSPAMDPIYQQTLANDPLSYGVGFVSMETQDGEWYDPATGKLYISDVRPHTTYLPAPKYRGYGPGFLCYVILPDRPEDVFKLDPRGALIQLQSATVQLPWWPQVGDNDLMVTVSLDEAGRVIEDFERFQLKQVVPITMRGEDRRGAREFPVNTGGNRYWIGQQCEVSPVPESANNPIYNVEIDR